MDVQTMDVKPLGQRYGFDAMAVGDSIRVHERLAKRVRASLSHWTKVHGQGREFVTRKDGDSILVTRTR